MYEIDVWSKICRRSPDNWSYSVDDIFLGRMKVNPTDDVQVFREQVRQKIPNAPDKIDLRFYRTEATEKDFSSESIMMPPTPPSALLRSYNKYTIQEVINKTPTTYDYADELKHYFNLKVLKLPKVEAVNYYSDAC